MNGDILAGARERMTEEEQARALGLVDVVRLDAGRRHDDRLTFALGLRACIETDLEL
ncbi:hypothetical protein [Kitasatospora putterlickiae]|uniref:hypothetical protein n=1 Tax=Kitasatospora putterlickiae TaxID=221725 RepID=UPI0031D5256E